MTVKGAANALIKKTAYSTQQELKVVIEDYLDKNNKQFLKGFKNNKGK